MYRIALLLALPLLTSCGLESASTAATVAKLKTEEAKEAQKTLDKVRTEVAKATAMVNGQRDSLNQ